MTHLLPEAFETEILSSLVGELTAEYGDEAVAKAFLENVKDSEALARVHGEATGRVALAIIREVVFSGNPRLAAEVVAMACGFFADSGTLRAVARKHGVDHKYVSTRVAKFCEEYGLEKPTFYRANHAGKGLDECTEGKKGTFGNPYVSLDYCDKWARTRRDVPLQMSQAQARAHRLRFQNLVDYVNNLNKVAQ